MKYTYISESDSYNNGELYDVIKKDIQKSTVKFEPCISCKYNYETPTGMACETYTVVNKIGDCDTWCIASFKNSFKIDRKYKLERLLK